MNKLIFFIDVLKVTDKNFFNNGKPKILFQETPLGNNSGIFNDKKTTIITQTEVPLTHF